MVQDNLSILEESPLFLYHPCVMPLTKQEVSALAHLARVALDEDEVARAEKELDGILGYVDRLRNVDTKGVEEAASMAVQANAFREDVAMPSTDESRQLIIQNFPAKQNDLLKAPAVFERPKK